MCIRDSQSIATPLIGMAQDGLASFEPAYVDELAVILRWAFDYIQRAGDAEPDAKSWLRDMTGGSVYFRLSTRPVEQLQRAITSEQAKDMIDGAYWMRRLRLLEEAGIIKGYTAVIDQKKAGLPISAFASIKLERQREEDLDRFAQAVTRWPEVVDCHLMTGQRDYLMRVLVRDLQDYERFLKEKLTRLECIASIETSFALSRVK